VHRSLALAVSEEILDEYYVSPPCFQVGLGGLLWRTQEDICWLFLFCTFLAVELCIILVENALLIVVGSL